MSSHRLNKFEIDGLEIMGYSVAGEETVVAIPQLDICFDIGKAPDQVIAIPNCLLSHGHIDHTAGLAYYLSHRVFTGQKPGNVYVPENLITPIEQIIDGWGQLDGNKILVNLVGVKAGDEFMIKPNLISRVFSTVHSRGAVGYSIIEKRKKIRPEFSKLTGPQIVELKRQGVEIDYPVEIPLVTYLGDTAYGDFLELDFVRNSKILITECTFYLDEHLSRAQAGRHMHITDLVRLTENTNNQHIVVTHLSQRTGLHEIRKKLKDMVSPELYEKITLLMSPYKNGRN